MKLIHAALTPLIRAYKHSGQYNHSDFPVLTLKHGGMQEKKAKKAPSTRGARRDEHLPKINREKMSYLFVLAGAFVVPLAAGAVWFSPPLQPVKTAHVTRPNSAIRAMILFIGEGKTLQFHTKEQAKSLEKLSNHSRRPAKQTPWSHYRSHCLTTPAVSSPD
ncbi:MAG: hypothetical protein ACLQVX_04335 [Limisphaerales bacterium]